MLVFLLPCVLLYFFKLIAHMTLSQQSFLYWDVVYGKKLSIDIYVVISALAHDTKKSQS